MELQEKKILILKLLNEDLGIDVCYVREVLRPQEIHHLIHAPDFIEGVINLRGHIIAVIDLRKRLDIKVEEENINFKIVICCVQKLVVGLIVDSVSEVLDVPIKDITPTPEVVSMQIKDCYVSSIARLGDKVVPVLNLENILTNEDLDRLKEIRK